MLQSSTVAPGRNSSGKISVVSGKLDIPPTSTNIDTLDGIKTGHDETTTKVQTIGDDDSSATVYLTGLKLHLITAAFCTTLFLTNLEIPIVTTSLISITNDLHSFDQSSWIISGYMLGYVSMIIIWAKLSDILGRKPIALAAMAIFTIFSGACGAAQTMTQLIIFRAFQGLGGGGNFALGTIVFLELVPMESYPTYTSGVSIVFSMSLLIGPIIGGALNHADTWRWVFLLNVPIGVACIVAILICMPFEFPYQGQEGPQHNPQHGYHVVVALFSKKTFKRVDFIGAALLLVATTFSVAALEEAGREYAWDSAFVIAFLIIASLVWILFIIWERTTSSTSGLREPVFPWRLMGSRIWIGMVLNALFLGAPWFVTIFQLPQRFQVVNHASALSAGLRLIPFTLAAPFGSGISAAAAGKLKIPPIYLVIGASCLQTIGFSLLSTLPQSREEANSQYGYQIIAGFGVGINISTLFLMTPYSIKEKRDEAVAMGSVSQFRIMGGVIGLAIVTAAYKSYVASHLNTFLTLSEQTRLLKTAEAILQFDAVTQEKITMVFAGAYNLQFRILIAFAGAQIPSSLLMWQKNQIRI